MWKEKWKKEHRQDITHLSVSLGSQRFPSFFFAPADVDRCGSFFTPIGVVGCYRCRLRPPVPPTALLCFLRYMYNLFIYFYSCLFNQFIFGLRAEFCWYGGFNFLKSICYLCVFFFFTFKVYCNLWLRKN